MGIWQRLKRAWELGGNVFTLKDAVSYLLLVFPISAVTVTRFTNWLFQQLWVVQTLFALTVVLIVWFVVSSVCAVVRGWRQPVIGWGVRTAGLDVYLAITNVTIAKRTIAVRAQVESVLGARNAIPTPFFVRWHEGSGEEARIGPNETRLLHLARLEPDKKIKGNDIASAVARLGEYVPGRFRLIGLSQEHPAHLDVPSAELMFLYRIVVTVGARIGEAVSDARAVVIGLQEPPPMEWSDTTVYAEIKPTPLESDTSMLLSLEVSS